MLFVSNDFRVLLLSRHLALKDVSTFLTKEIIIEKIERLRWYFQSKLNIKKPSFALCALNPHAGENGILGREEIEIIIPVVEALRNRGINITNPLPADTLFEKGVQNYLAGEKSEYDCYIACYHDQGLIPIKSVAANKTVNMTIGLDIIRTSPSHGTAFDIAGKNIANPASMIEAIKTCLY
jgi:4-hydroxythreonine-4-phosphate dehydrogenase